MTLPRSVQMQADMAKQHFDALQNPEPSTLESADKTPVAPDAAQPADTQATPVTDQHSQSNEPKPATKPDEPQRSEAYWEHRFNVINGKYAAEVPALREEVKTLTQTLAQKDRALADLSSTPSPTANPGGLTDEQLSQFNDEFGEDFVSFVQRMVAGGKPDNSAEVNDLKRKVDSFEQKEHQKTEASFWSVLNELVPDWKATNAHDGFHAFLAQYDPQTGKQRQQTLTTAQQALDADGVAAVFNAFKKQQPQPQQRIPDDQVDPPTSRSTTTPEGGRIWTGPEIKRFYTDKANGKFSAAEGKRLEADIFAAQSEGRVR